MNNRKKKNGFVRFITILLVAVILFKPADYLLSEIADLRAYKDASQVNDEVWRLVHNKIEARNSLSDEDYEMIFSQTGLGKPAVDRLIWDGNEELIEEYRNYYTKDKDFDCERAGIFAHHEVITDSEGNTISNPPFADIQNGDIILTLSIHSLGWRHGHAAIVTDAGKAQTVQAVMMGKKSDSGSLAEWNSFPLVAVLRAKNTDSETRAKIADYAAGNLVGIEYSLFSDILGKGDADELPESTHCAHLVWYAYNQFGIDIDSNGGNIVTPYEILHSEELEIVQIYGNII
ncbi:MAG: hypothetical protein ACI4N4_00750 [Candidatus Fimenecus sp.]